MNVVRSLYDLVGVEIAYVDGSIKEVIEGDELIIAGKDGTILMGKWGIYYDENDNPEAKLHIACETEVKNRLLKPNNKWARDLVDIGVLQDEFKEHIEAARRLEAEQMFERDINIYLNMKARLEPQALTTYDEATTGKKYVCAWYNNDLYAREQTNDTSNAVWRKMGSY